MEPSSAAFLVEHDDAEAGVRKHYVLSYWEADCSVAMYDTHAKRAFLKRVVPPEKPALGSFFLGATVVVCSRPLKVLDYADDATRRRFAALRGTALMLVKPDGYHALGKLLQIITRAGLEVGRIRMMRLAAAEAAAFYAISGAEARGDSAGHLASDHTTGVEVVGDDVFARLHELTGPANPADARAAAPTSIRYVLRGESAAASSTCLTPHPAPTRSHPIAARCSDATACITACTSAWTPRRRTRSSRTGFWRRRPRACFRTAAPWSSSRPRWRRMPLVPSWMRCWRQGLRCRRCAASCCRARM